MNKEAMMGCNVYQVGFGIPCSIDFMSVGIFNDIESAAESAAHEIGLYLETFPGSSCLQHADTMQWWIDAADASENESRARHVLVYIFSDSGTALGYVELTPAKTDSITAREWLNADAYQ